MRRTGLKVTQQGKSRDLNPGLGPVQCSHRTARAPHEVLGPRGSAAVFSAAAAAAEALLAFDYNGRLLGND